MDGAGSFREISRRDLLKAGAAASAAGLVLPLSSCAGPAERSGRRRGAPAAAAAAVVASTWSFGMRANPAAMRALAEGRTALDAVEAGVRVAEADPEVTSVGYGGTPNLDGVVELDAAVMTGHNLRCGGVAALQDIMHPVSVARLVMERTPHVLLVGDGARRFALQHGFQRQNLLTDDAQKRYEELKARAKAGAPAEGGHDTIGMIARDAEGRLAAAVTTSGLALKLPGRVGDSPLIGCGLYADDAAGACVSTGVGEEAIRVLGSFYTVECLRRGADPLSAVMDALQRVRRANPGREDFQLAFLAMTPEGAVAGGALQAGFQYALSDNAGRHELVDGEVL